MLNYHLLTPQQYVDLLVNFISSWEGHAAAPYQKPNDHTTIGYGYTFFRNNNLSLWQAAGITLTSAEVREEKRGHSPFLGSLTNS